MSQCDIKGGIGAAPYILWSRFSDIQVHVSYTASHRKQVLINSIINQSMQIAKNDFRDVSTKELFVGAFRSIQWIIRIGKHLGALRQRQFTSVKWRNDNTEVGIPNDSGQYLYVPKTILDIYTITPSRILSDMLSLVARYLFLIAIVPANTEY